MKLKSPCLNCQERYPGCQGECILGIAYIDHLKQRNQTIKRERDKIETINTYKVEAIRKTKAKVGR